jgi:hypothetical protein
MNISRELDRAIFCIRSQLCLQISPTTGRMLALVFSQINEIKIKRFSNAMFLPFITNFTAMAKKVSFY